MSRPPPQSSPEFPSGYASTPAAVPTTWLVLGIGCRSGTSLDEIEAAVRIALECSLGSRPIGKVRQVATISSKLTEPALIEFCTRYDLPLVGFSGQAINACTQARKGLARSRAAREYAGVDGVCEPCALLAAPNGTLIGRKRALGGVTVAIAAAAVPQTAPGSIWSSAIDLNAIESHTQSFKRQP